MRTLREIRERSYAVAATAIAAGAREARDRLVAVWAMRTAANLHAGNRVVLGFAEADAAIGRLAELPTCAGTRDPAPPAPRWHCPTCAAAFWARHHLTIYIKLTALPYETGGFGVESVLE